MKYHILAVVASICTVAEGNRLKTARPPSPWAAAEGTGPIVEGLWSDGSRSANVTGKKQDCHPQCLWKCLGEATCQETCEPVCAPPQCSTSCQQLKMAKCVQKCDSPRCAVICPEKQCEGGKNCGACKTVCGEPVCRVQCEQDCKTTCADPVCDWKCKPTAQCPEPKCHLNCGPSPDCAAGVADGGAKKLVEGVAKVPPGAVVVSRGLASLDPSAFQTEASVAAAPSAAPVMSPATA
mmetsp:Transcript_120990/g.170225  ORF Transcript_120990/g.170225 Transcript_120990/m.170225 type:complete len:237 (+) Transcript_120990:49-759(+)